MTNTISSRTTSGFPLSIGTGLAMESLFDFRTEPYDKERKLPERVDVSKYNEIWINLYTLYRNMNGACDKDVLTNSKPEEVLSALEMEIDVINSLFQAEGNNICKPQYYYCTYDHLRMIADKKSFLLRPNDSVNQKNFDFMFAKVMHLLFKKTDVYFKLDSEIKPTVKNNSLLLSHVPYDLLSFSNFKKLDLIESHTGILKQRYSWNSKYYQVGENDMSIFPFHRKLLFIFGDKILIKPAMYKLRLLIVETAIKRKWTSFSTEAKMMQDLSLDIKEPFVLDHIRKL